MAHMFYLCEFLENTRTFDHDMFRNVVGNFKVYDSAMEEIIIMN